MQVKRYLTAFKEHFRLDHVIEYETKVVNVTPHDAGNGTWKVELKHSDLNRTVKHRHCLLTQKRDVVAAAALGSAV